MPRSNKFTREQILEAGLELTRQKGFVAVSARSLGEQLGTTYRPILSHFDNMADVQAGIKEATNELYLSYIKKEIAEGKYPPYKASGIAYIRFAKEERELFKLLFMCDRSSEKANKDPAEMNQLIELIYNQVGIDREKARLFYLEMWTFTHGIATMIATSYYTWDEELISTTLTDMYEGLKAKYSDKEK